MIFSADAPQNLDARVSSYHPVIVAVPSPHPEVRSSRKEVAMRRTVPAAFALTVLAACASQSVTITSYVDPAFDVSRVKSILLLSMRGTSLTSSELARLDQQVITGLTQNAPATTVMSSTEATDALTGHGLAAEWESIFADYSASGHLDSIIISRVGDLFGVDAVIQMEVVEVREEGDARGGGTSADYIRGRGAWHAGQVGVTVRFAMLECDTGGLIWEASSYAASPNVVVNERTSPTVEALMLAVEEAIGKVPGVGGQHIDRF
jgi:hypothetical protein